MIEEDNTSKKVDTQAIDIMKIQIYADRCYAKFASLLSFVFAYFLALIVLWYSVLYQNLGPSPVFTWEVGMVGTGVSTLGFLAYILWDYRNETTAISDLIQAVEQGERLPEFSKVLSKKKS